jgi:hypothetical protein
MDSDEASYTPENPNYYNYTSIQNLSIPNDNDNINMYENVNICCYEINNDGKHPFLKFLLKKHNYFQNLSFHKIPLSNNIIITEWIQYIKLYLCELLLLEDFKKFNKDMEINGFYEYNSELFLFIDVTSCKLIVDDIYHDSNLWFVLADEILNNKHVCNIKIDSFVFRFFSNNYQFCVLQNENNEIYETPMVGYVSKPESKLNFTYIFGVTANDKSAILGPYYYFTDYNNAMKQCCKLNEKKCGIVRFALFTGTTKYIENFPNDDIDNSEIKKERLNDDELDKSIEQLTIRISDHDGKWTESSDSCYLGRMVLDNGAVLEETPLIVLKDYNQQVSLSYHYINKRASQNTNKPEYFIL